MQASGRVLESGLAGDGRQRDRVQRLVLADETGPNTSLSPLYAWAPKGERARCSVPRNRGANTTLLASMSISIRNHHPSLMRGLTTKR